MVMKCLFCHNKVPKHMKLYCSKHCEKKFRKAVSENMNKGICIYCKNKKSILEDSCLDCTKKQITYYTKIVEKMNKKIKRLKEIGRWPL